MAKLLYPVNVQTFEVLIKDNYIYVDKTDLVYSLVKECRICFLSRPRRFGKSLLLSTIQAYFEGKQELFKGLKIESLEKEWCAYKVFHLDMSGIDWSLPNALHARLDWYLSSWEAEYGIKSSDINPSSRFVSIIKKAAEKSGRRVVVLVDEYDNPLLDVLGVDDELFNCNRMILKAFYSAFKLADAYLKFVFITGVSKFPQVSIFSGFNQPTDISMISRYDKICGITDDELHQYFAQPILNMAANLGCSSDVVYQQLKDRYDGYHFSEAMIDIYNPFSLINALFAQKIKDYWFASGSTSYLIRLLNNFNDSIDQFAGEEYSADEFLIYHPDYENPLPVLYQSGYLSIKEYKHEEEQFVLDFPNKEVKKALMQIVAANYLKTTENKIGSLAKKVVLALNRGKIDVFFASLTSFLASIPYSMRRKSDEVERERYFQYTFYLILRLISSFNVKLEQEQSEGRVDCIVETTKYIYIFEFKLDGSAKNALKQIDDKGYARPYGVDNRILFKIGVNFSSQTGTISDWQYIIK